MPVSNQETVFNHVGNGLTTTFAYSCKVEFAEDLSVFVNDAKVTSGFSISGVGVNTGGTVTFTAPPAAGVKVRIERIIELKRSTDYQQNGDFLAKVANSDFDRLWMVLQQLSADTSRAIKFPKSQAILPDPLPIASSRANKALIFGADGNVTVSADDYVNQFSLVAAQVALAAAQAGIATAKAGEAGSSAAAAAVSAAAAIDAGDYLNSYIDQILLNVTFPLDLGLVADAVITNTFDLGVL